jgi:hypothetical protein
MCSYFLSYTRSSTISIYYLSIYLSIYLSVYLSIYTFFSLTIYAGSPYLAVNIPIQGEVCVILFYMVFTF